MSRREAEKAATEMIMSGYRHHTYEVERGIYQWMFQSERDEFIKYLDSPDFAEQLAYYADVVGPTRLRARKNLLVCLIYTVCRVAIDEHVNVEFSFALSDYYLNQMELIEDEKGLQALSREILLHYYDLVQKEKRQVFTKPVASAVRYIGRNLYGPCRVRDVARHVNLEAHYFSGLFTKQVGMPPGRYILQKKLEEGKRMLTGLDATVTQTAESLGFCDTAHFSRCFKEAFGMPPSALCRRDAPRNNQ